jgi:orotate phosphoribosyltransferase
MINGMIHGFGFLRQMNNKQNPFLIKELYSLLSKFSYKTGNFKLSSGKISDYFIDCKQTVLQHYGHYLVGEVFYCEIEEINWKYSSYHNLIIAVAGVELGGCPIASAVSLTSHYKNNHWQPKLSALYIRKDVKDHGSKQLIEGSDSLPKGCHVILVEDTVTTGESSLKAVNKLREAGYEVNNVICLVDRLEGGKELLDREKINLSTIFTIKDFRC